MRKIYLMSLSVAAVSSVQAVTLARWTPVSVAADATIGGTYNEAIDTPAPDEVAPSLLVSSLDRLGSAETATNAGAVWPGTATPNTAEISLEGFTAFSIAPDAGSLVNYVTISYAYQTYGFHTTEGYNLFLRTSLDGFASDLTTSQIPADAANDGVVTFDASGLTGVTEEVEFRIYASAPSVSGNRWFDLRGGDPGLGLIVDGEVLPVPEPSTGLLSGLACLALIARRRRA